MTEVFEHLLNPASALKKIKTFLKPQGVVYISVIGVLCPTWRNIKKFAQVAHPYNFSLDTLAMVLGAHEFVLIAGNEGIQALFARSSSTPGQYVPNKKSFEAIKDKFLQLHLNHQKLSYRFKKSLKALVRETLSQIGLFGTVLIWRDKIRKLFKGF